MYRDEYGLNPKQRAFAEAYAESKSSYQAAVEAGYSPKSAGTSSSLMLRDERIQKVIAERKKDLATRTRVSKEWLVRRLLRTATGAIANRQYGPAVRAYQLVGEMHGYFPKGDTNIDARKQILVLPPGMSDEELRRIAAGDLPNA